MTVETFPSIEVDKQMTVTQKQLLEGAILGKGITQELVVGGAPAADGVTFEEARSDLFNLIDDGLIELDNKYTPYLTDKGIEVLANLR
jgi:hypothetical protein